MLLALAEDSALCKRRQAGHVRSGALVGVEERKLHELVIRGFGGEEPGEPSQGCDFRVDGMPLTHEDYAAVFATLALPATVQRREVLLIVSGQDGAQFGGESKVKLVALAADTELRRQIKQMARRAELADQTACLDAVVKVNRYHA